METVTSPERQYQFDVTAPLVKDTPADRDRLMRWWIVSGDSRRLPVSIRHRADLYELRYRKGDLLMVAYSGAWDEKPENAKDRAVGTYEPPVGDTATVQRFNDELWKNGVRECKDGARKTLRDWLGRNDIPVGAVQVQGLEEKADYRVRFRVEAVVSGRRPVSLFVPPWGDDWWKEMQP